MDWQQAQKGRWQCGINPKAEGRNPKQARRPKSENRGRDAGDWLGCQAGETEDPIARLAIDLRFGPRIGVRGGGGFNFHPGWPFGGSAPCRYLNIGGEGFNTKAFCGASWVRDCE